MEPDHTGCGGLPCQGGGHGFESVVRSGSRKSEGLGPPTIATTSEPVGGHRGGRRFPNESGEVRE
jgi:hypothetical protein